MIKFGPAGNSEDFYNKGYKRTIEAPAYLKSMGLDLFEYSFGQGVSLKEETANAIREQAELNEIEISVHAPYYINFASEEEIKANNSFMYVTKSLEALKQLGGKRCVFHTGTIGKAEYTKAVDLAYSRLEKLAEIIIENGFDDCYICPETMGKRSQIGDVDDIIKFAKIAPFFVPAIDFGHINARNCGALDTKDDYRKILDKLLVNLDFYKVDEMHVHFSKIEYTQAGERRHLTFEDNVYGPRFEPLAELLVEYKLNPYIVCESAGTQSIDAQKMKSIYKQYMNDTLQ